MQRRLCANQANRPQAIVDTRTVMDTIRGKASGDGNTGSRRFFSWLNHFLECDCYLLLNNNSIQADRTILPMLKTKTPQFQSFWQSRGFRFQLYCFCFPSFLSLDKTTRFDDACYTLVVHPSAMEVQGFSYLQTYSIFSSFSIAHSYPCSAALLYHSTAFS